MLKTNTAMGESLEGVGFEGGTGPESGTHSVEGDKVGSERGPFDKEISPSLRDTPETALAFSSS